MTTGGPVPRTRASSLASASTRHASSSEPDEVDTPSRLQPIPISSTRRTLSRNQRVAISHHHRPATLLAARVVLRRLLEIARVIRSLVNQHAPSPVTLLY